MAGGDIDWTCVQCKIVQDGRTKKIKGKCHLITLFLGTCTGSQILEPLLNHGQSDRMWQIKWCSVMLYVSDSVTSHKTTDHYRFVNFVNLGCQSDFFCDFLWQMSCSGACARGMLKPVIPLPSLISARYRKMLPGMGGLTLTTPRQNAPGGIFGVIAI